MLDRPVTPETDDFRENHDELSTFDLPMNYDHMPSSRHQAGSPPQSLSSSSSLSSDSKQDLSKVFSDLCMACRSGDIETVDSLLSTPNLDINQVDEWDYSPLILASLCGHTKIVELLLSRGAVCDRDTFQGARCIYGALNDIIRELLISFDISKKVDMSQPFASHISSLLNPLSSISARDVVFHFPYVNNSLSRDLYEFRLNRFLLAARSPYFKDKFNGAWKHKAVIQMPESSDPVVFKIIVDYIYLRTDSLPIDQRETQDQLIKFAKKLRLDDLLRSIEMVNAAKNKKEKAKIKHEVSFMFVEKARKDMSSFLKENIIKNRIQLPIPFTDDTDFEDIDTRLFITKEQKLTLLNSDSIPDIILSAIDAELESLIYFPVNKSILARSEYFETMLKSDIFLSSQEDLPIYKDYKGASTAGVIDRPLLLPEHLAVIQISSSSSFEIAELLLSFLYHDDVQQIPLSLAIELLFAADELFLERLKTICAVNITSQFNKLTYNEFKSLCELVGYDAYDLIRVSWQTRCDKLEHHITKLIAYNLAQIHQNAEERKKFSLLIKESASRIEERQDTDTIELIDDIRYYLSKKYAVNDEFKDFESIGEQFREADPGYIDSEDILIFKKAMVKYNRDIQMIDSLLNELGLDA